MSNVYHSASICNIFPQSHCLPEETQLVLVTVFEKYRCFPSPLLLAHGRGNWTCGRDSSILGFNSSKLTNRNRPVVRDAALGLLSQVVKFECLLKTSKALWSSLHAQAFISTQETILIMIRNHYFDGL